MLSYLRSSSILLYVKRLKISLLKNHHKLAIVERAKTNRDGAIIFCQMRRSLILVDLMVISSTSMTSGW